MLAYDGLERMKETLSWHTFILRCNNVSSARAFVQSMLLDERRYNTPKM